MADFPAAYKKVFVVNTFATSGAIEDYFGGQFGFFDASTWTVVPVSEANKTDHPSVVLVTPSFHDKDQIGPHGGYQESMKSQIIKPYQIRRFWKVAGRYPQAQIVILGWNTTDASTAPRFLCGKDYTLRIDLRGVSILRMLGLNAFQQYSVNTGCCADAADPKLVDPIAVMVEFAKQINSSPVFKSFISAGVLSGDGPDAGTAPDPVNLSTYVPLTDETAINSATAALVLTVTNLDCETFDDCSYDPRGGFASECSNMILDPVRIISAQLVTDTTSACPDFKQLTFTESQPPVRGEGNSMRVLQDFVLSLSYQQDIFPFDPRRKEIENLDIIHDYVVANIVYDSYYILHTVDRKSNPSGVYDRDYYLLQLNTPVGADMTEFVNWMNSYMASATPGMAMEDLSNP